MENDGDPFDLERLRMPDAVEVPDSVASVKAKRRRQQFVRFP